ncbi:MAG: hypothetical protein ACQ9CV_00225 [Nitrosopumilus sp.]|jgi:hypothetical protein
MPKNRRGLSSVVGALFFTVLMIAGFSVLSLALDAQTDIVTTQRLVSDVEIKKQQEQFEVSISTGVNDVLNVNVNNQGQNPVEISSIWITNKTLPDQPATRYDVNYDDAFVPSGFTSNVVLSQNLKMIPDAYDVKVVSSHGIIKTAEFDMAGFTGLRAELITDPPDVVLGKNVTVAMIVTNTAKQSISNIEPEMQPLGGTAFVIDSTSHTPPSVNLKSGESVMFSWDYQVDGVSGDDMVFSAIAKGDLVGTDDVISNIVSDSIRLREAGEGGGGGEIVISNELFGKPQIYMVVPNALGDEDRNEIDRPIWGVNIANPTDQPIFVNKVVIIAIAPRATATDAIFVAGCETGNNTPEKAVTISPTPDKWTCPESNQLMWRDTINPQRIEPRSVFPFLVEVGSGNMGSALPDAQNILIQPLVFTTLGQFGKSGGYGSTMHSSNVAMPNVFLTRDVQSINSTDIMSELRGIQEGTTVKFNATIADMSSESDYGILANTDLIINIPKEWTFNSIVSHVGFDVPTVVTYPDGSTQISGNLNQSIDDHTEAKTIQFTATAPFVPKTKMYVMHILANGLASGAGGAGTFTVGPIAENVLQVCPTSGCP